MTRFPEIFEIVQSWIQKSEKELKKKEEKKREKRIGITLGGEIRMRKRIHK